MKMVARNFSMQELSYSRLLQIPEEEREYLELEELKPNQLGEYGIEPNNSVNHDGGQSGDTEQQQLVQQLSDIQSNAYQHAIYYDLNAQNQTT